MKFLKTICLLLFISSVGYGQEATLLNYSATSTFNAPDIKIPRLNLGIELQWYPSGMMYGGRADLYLGRHANWNFRIAYNDTNRKDRSPHNLNEEGGGFGAGLGYRYFLGKREGLFFGGRVDIWKLEIDWEDIDMNMNPTMGNTNISVFQPTIELGYQFVFDKHWAVAPAFAFGYELNVKTEGDKVGGGMIGLIGVNVGYKMF